MKRGARVGLCRTLALGALLGAVASCGPPDSGRNPNVLLITLDTTRADRLGCYGYARDTSPHLDALAAHSTRYTRAYSTSSWTLPAHASLFTGKFPTSHGARFDSEGSLILGDAIRAPDDLRARPLAPEEATLAGLLGAAGYDTGAVVAGPWMLKRFGLAAGFSFYDDEDITSHAGRRAPEVTNRAITWLERPREGPFFLFLNYFDPHYPYEPPDAFAGRFLLPGSEPRPGWRGHFPALYDAEIAYTDAEVGRLLDYLRARGDFEDTLVVVTSDHGELLGEHGEWGHQRFLYEELTRIPLLVKAPGSPTPGRVESDPVQILDVFALVLEQAGVGSPASAQAQVPGRVRHPIVAEVRRNDASADGDWRALWDGDLKVLRSSKGRDLVFDLARDPGEAADLSLDDRARGRQALARLEAAFEAMPSPPASGPQGTIDPETRDALKRLGYIE